ncbi:hypothetical protein ACNPM8_07755 [Glutamicibacter sp. AGC46]
MTTPLEALTTAVRLQAERIEQLEQELAEEHLQYQLWKFRAVENGRSTKHYKKLYQEQLDQNNNK